jgi:hypothetical protein
MVVEKVVMSASEQPARPRSEVLAVLCFVFLAVALTLAAMVIQRNPAGRDATGHAAPSSPETAPLNRQMADKLARIEESIAQAQAAMAVVPPTVMEAGLPARSVGPPPAPLRERHTPTTPAPQLMRETNAAGGVVERRVFAALTGRDGKVLARDAELGRVLGRRLFFRVPAGPPVGFDVDALHPDVLHYLGLNAQEIKAAHELAEQQRLLAAEQAEKARMERLEREREWFTARKEALAEHARAAGHAASESALALAALRAVESANARAQTPPAVVVVQQPQPVWTWPVVWFRPRPHCPAPVPVPPPAPTPVPPPGSDFQFISKFQFIQQGQSTDPFALGRRL